MGLTGMGHGLDILNATDDFNMWSRWEPPAQKEHHRASALCCTGEQNTRRSPTQAAALHLSSVQAVCGTFQSVPSHRLPGDSLRGTLFSSSALKSPGCISGSLASSQESEATQPHIKCTSWRSSRTLTYRLHNKEEKGRPTCWQWGWVGRRLSSEAW